MKSNEMKSEESLLRQRRTPPPRERHSSQGYKKRTTESASAAQAWISKIRWKRELGLCLACLIIWCIATKTGLFLFSAVFNYWKGTEDLVKDSKEVIGTSYDLGLDDIPKYSVPSEVENFADMRISGKIIAVGDLHGDLQNARTVLRMAGVINETNDWSFGRKTLVQTGDILDRGEQSIEILKLFIKLKWQARKVGGKVINILGNHEVMNLLTDYRYVNTKEFERWGGYTGWDKLFNHRSELGKVLRSWPTAVKIRDTLFAHAGVEPKFARKGINEINRRVWEGLAINGYQDQIFSDEGPHWTRSYANWGRGTMVRCKLLPEVLLALNVSRMVIGHNPQSMIRGPNVGKPDIACGGKLFLIDSGISSYYGGYLSALEILDNGKTRVIFPT